jgi:hypothetical protein
MLSILIFFILGMALGALGLRLLAHWNQGHVHTPGLGHSHRRH